MSVPAANKPINILVFSTLYPNAAQKRHGIFVETRLRHLLESGQVNAEVLAPVPWFPFSSERWGEYGQYARVPHREQRHNIKIEHPRYLVLPKIGMTRTPEFLFKTAKKAIQKMLKRGFDFDLIDAHYFYPDGVAAIKLGEFFNKPVVITARGTDLNLIPQYPKPKAMIQEVTEKADGMITVCQALKDVLLEDFGVADDRVHALRNGVDLKLFHPQDRMKLRDELGFKRKTLISCGHLIPRKGHNLVIEAMVDLPDYDLCIVGDGQDEQLLHDLAIELNVADRVRFAGALLQDDLCRYYNAADALVLASSREGWANVLLEAMACGTPVVATNVWGTPEVVATPEAGVLIQERSGKGIAVAVNELFENYPEHTDTRAYAEKFSWDDTTQGQLDLFNKILKRKTS